MQMVFTGYVPDAQFRIEGMDAPSSTEDWHHPYARNVRKHMPDLWDDYYTFAFVRNPWDRLVSWYMMAHQTNVATASLDQIRKLSFEQFLEIKDDLHLCSNQLDYITDEDGKIIVDFVGRFENLKPEFRDICNKLGVFSCLRHHNGTRHEAYQHYYTEHTRQLVAHRFARDITTFGYAFD